MKRNSTFAFLLCKMVNLDLKIFKWMPTNKTWNSSYLWKGTYTVPSLYSPIFLLNKILSLLFS